MADTYLYSINHLPLGNILTYFGQSNLAGQVIVLVLIAFSLLAWTVMVGKYLDLERLRGANRLNESNLSQEKSILRSELSRAGRGPYAYLVKEAVQAYYRARRSGQSEAAQIGQVENALQRAVAEATLKYESKMVVLGSIVTGAPFLGLLGTVWGVMDAFGGIATGDSGASIQALAPGVSGALLTTVAGLLVAIPSVFGYNFLLTQVKLMITEVENFASSLADRIEIEANEEMLQK